MNKTAKYQCHKNYAMNIIAKYKCYKNYPFNIPAKYQCHKNYAKIYMQHINDTKTIPSM